MKSLLIPQIDTLAKSRDKIFLLQKELVPSFCSLLINPNSRKAVGKMVYLLCVHELQDNSYSVFAILV